MGILERILERGMLEGNIRALEGNIRVLERNIRGEY